jgi:TP901 family phage tail tape measure protein
MAGKELKTVITLEGKVADSLKRAFDDVEKRANGTGGAFSKFGGFAATAGKAIVGGFAAAGAAATAFAATSVKTGMTFDKSMSQVAATMGMTMEEMATMTGEVDTQFGHFEGTLRDFAQYMGSNTAFSASEAADALNYMALAGYDAQTSMSMLPNVLNLAAAGGMELATASDMITDTQTAFGLSLERTTLMVDEMAKAASTGNTSVQQLGEAFLVVGGLAQELNGGMVQLGEDMYTAVDGTQELEIALTAMANAGIKGSEAGTHMRNMLLKLSDPTDAGTLALEKMGVTVFDTEGKMRSLQDIFGDLNREMTSMSQEEKIQTIGALFNSRDIASSEALLKAVSQDWNEIGKSVLDAQWKLEDVTAAMQGADIDWSKYKYPVEEMGADIRGYLTTMQMTSEEAAEALSKNFGLSMTDALKAVQAVESGMADSVGAAAQMAATQLDNLDGDVTIFKSAFEGLQIAVSDTLSPMLRDFVQFGTNSISAITEGMKSGGLAGAGEVIKNMFITGIQDLRSSLPGMIAPLVSSVFGVSMDQANGMIKMGQSMAEGLFIGMQDSLMGNIESVKPVFEGLWKTITGTFEPVIKGLMPVANGVFQMLAMRARLISSAINKFSPIFANIINSLMPAFITVGEVAGTILTSAGTTMTTYVIPGIETFANVAMNAMASVMSAVAPVVDRISQFVTAIMPTMMPFIQSLYTMLGALFQNVLVPIGSWLMTTLGSAISTAVRVVGAALDTVLSFVEPILPGIIQTFTGVIDFLTGVFTGDWQKAWEGIKGIFAGVWNSLTGIVRGVITSIVKGINHVINGVNSFIASTPAQALEAVGITVKIPTIPVPQFAKGGTVTSPTLAMIGEGGAPETVIPHTNTAESRRLLGIAAAGVLGTGATITGGSSNSQTFNITYSPVIQGAGLTDKNLQDQYEQFKRFMAQFSADFDREALA